jgi:hypothetical protein
MNLQIHSAAFYNFVAPPEALVPENISSVTIFGGGGGGYARGVCRSVLSDPGRDQLYANACTDRTPRKHQKGEGGGFKQKQTNAANSLSR